MSRGFLKKIERTATKAVLNCGGCQLLINASGGSKPPPYRSKAFDCGWGLFLFIGVIPQILKPAPSAIGQEKAYDGQRQHGKTQWNHPPKKCGDLTQIRKNAVGGHHHHDADKEQCEQRSAVGTGFDLFHRVLPLPYKQLIYYSRKKTKRQRHTISLVCRCDEIAMHEERIVSP